MTPGVVKLARALGLLAAPFACLYGFAWYVLSASGELEPVERVIEVQRTSAGVVLFGPAYTDNTTSYKLRAVLRRRPEVVVLGSSRVMPIRTEFFRRGVSFYNAGARVRRVEYFNDFLERLPAGGEPRVIIAGLDQWLFAPGLIVPTGAALELTRPDPTPVQILGNRLRVIFRDYLVGKYTLRGLMSEKSGALSFGTRARVQGRGFRNDGSYRFTVEADPEVQEKVFQAALRDMVAPGVMAYAPGLTVSSEVVGEVRRFLLACRARGIYVVGFLPPFRHRILEVLTSAPDRYGYLAKIAPTLAPVFEEAGFGFFDFSDLARLGASDEEALDTMHMSEKAYVRLFVEMVRRDAVLRRFVADVESLSATLAGSRSHYHVFGDGDESN